MGCDCEKNDKFSFAAAVKSVSNVVTSAVKVVTVKDYNPFVTKAESEERLNICRNCEMHITTLGKSRCKICGCFLGAKTILKDQSCPHPAGQKWQSLT